MLNSLVLGKILKRIMFLIQELTMESLKKQFLQKKKNVKNVLPSDALEFVS